MKAWQLSEEQMSKIANYINTINEENMQIMLFPHIDNGILLGVSVRFHIANASTKITEEKEASIREKIIKTSHCRLVPEQNGLLKYGILELKFCSISRFSDEWIVIDTLEYVANEMLDDLRS